MHQQLTWRELSLFLAQAQKGHDESLEKVFEFLRSRLLVIARYRVQEDAEDLVQEAMVVVHNHLSEFETLEGLLAFTHQVLRNKIGNVYQGRSRQKQRKVGMEDVAEPQYHINEDIEATEMDRIVRKSIDKLREKRPHCGAILSCLYNGFDASEISKELGISKSRLKVQTFRCRESLREILVNEYGLRL